MKNTTLKLCQAPILYCLLLLSSILSAQNTIAPPAIAVSPTVWDGTRWSDGIPDNTKKAILTADLTTSDVITAKDIQIDKNAKLTLETGGLLKLTYKLSDDTKKRIIFRNNTGVFSNNEGPSNNEIPPPTTFVRTNHINEWTDILMSSPVSGQVIGTTHASNAYDQHNYVTGTGWVAIADTTVMLPCIGYSETTDGTGAYNAFALYGGTSGDYNQEYTGTENTGNYSTSVSSGFNLLGNPYGRYLDSDSFLLDAANTEASAIYLWTHNTLANTSGGGGGTFSFTSNDYAIYNVLGGITAGRGISAGGIGPTDNQLIPDGRIQFGTGFFLRCTSSGNVTFDYTNMSTTSGGGQIFRQSANPSPLHNSNGNNTALISPPDRSRIRINLSDSTSPIPNYRQALIGYADHTDATSGGTDRLFDCPVLDQSSFYPKIDIYSLASGSSTKLAIQGRNLADFAGTDFFQLGFKVTAAGNYTFSATGDGIFEPGQKDYYIWDNGVLHDFPYTVTFSANEASDTRFRIVFGERGITLKLFIEGYYDSSSDQMVPVMVNQNTSINPSEAGLIDVAIMNGTTQVEEIQDVMLHVDGTTGLIPYANTTPTGLYRIRVRHRNAIETWSSETNLVQIGGSASYDFSNAANKAYGSNQVQVDSSPVRFAFYSGDLNQDENIENTDFTIQEIDITNSEFGDRPADLNGDGVVDNSDADFLINNANNFIYSQHP